MSQPKKAGGFGGDRGGQRGFGGGRGFDRGSRGGGRGFGDRGGRGGRGGAPFNPNKGTIIPHAGKGSELLWENKT